MLESMPLISIIVPIYKVEQYLDRCIDSIVSQTYSNLELILVDDGSPDGCPKKCDNWAEKDKRIRVIHKKNGGLSDARNAGMETAKGNYISFIDSDDWIEPDFYKVLLDAIQENQCEIAGCKYRRTSKLSKETGKIGKTACYDCVLAMDALIDNIIEQVVWNKLYDRNIVNDVLFEKGKYHEDEFWSYQVFGKITRYVEVDYIGYNYFVRSDSIMGEAYSLKRLDAIEAKTIRQTYLEKNFPELALKGNINLMFSCLYHGQLAMRELDKEERKDAIQYLKSVVKEYPIALKKTKGYRATHIIWLCMAQLSFVGTCRIRNILKVGL